MNAEIDSSAMLRKRYKLEMSGLTRKLMKFNLSGDVEVKKGWPTSNKVFDTFKTPSLSSLITTK